MQQSRGWGLSRYVALFVVLALHLAFFAALMRTSRNPGVDSSMNAPVELLYLPPARFPRVRAENARPTRIKGDTVAPMEPLLLGSTGSAQAPAAAASNGDGSGVDWKAEARRAPRRHSRFAIMSRRARTLCRARRPRIGGGRGRGTMPAINTRLPAAIGSSGSIRAATKLRWPEGARMRRARCCPRPCVPARPAGRAVNRRRSRRGPRSRIPRHKRRSVQNLRLCQGIRRLTPVSTGPC